MALLSSPLNLAIALALALQAAEPPTGPAAAPPSPQPAPAPTETEGPPSKTGPRPLLGVTPRPGPSADLPKPPKDPAQRREWLKTQLDEVFGSKEFAKAKISAIVVDADTGKPLYARAEKTPLNAASNVKIVTSAAGLSLLGPEYRWRTTLSITIADTLAFAIGFALKRSSSWVLSQAWRCAGSFGGFGRSADGPGRGVTPSSGRGPPLTGASSAGAGAAAGGLAGAGAGSAANSAQRNAKRGGLVNAQ